MSPLFVFILGCAVFFAVLAYIAMKYPRGRADWGKDRSETASLVASLLTFVILFLLLWYASATVDWPDAVIMTFWVALLVAAALVIVSIIYPEGLGFDWLKGDGKD